jgi:WS/DGAT/MGAT family acyltransferase
MAIPAWFERIGPGDAQQLATDVGPVPANVGAVLLLDPSAGADAVSLADVLARRVCAIPRMRQRLRGTPPGCGRAVWVDDPGFIADRHIEVVRCPSPGDEGALLALAVDTVTQPLDRARPLWRARLVTGLADGGVGLVLVLHHALADGIGGLAVLAGLVDPGAPAARPPQGPDGPPAGCPPPRPEPTAGTLLRDAWRARWRSLRGAPAAAATLAPALTELGRTRRARAPRSSLNAPTGPRRRVAVVRADLARVHAFAREHGATINDVLLMASSQALGSVLTARGERLPEVVISVPVSARTQATTEQLGNQVGVMPVRVPLGVPATEALAEVARTTAARRATEPGSSAALVAPAFRTLAALGLFRPMIDRQRVVNSFLTNMRGPDRPIALGGAVVRLIAPVTLAAGNVSIAFAALSYAGTLAVTVITDPDITPELDLLAVSLERGLSLP